MGSALGSSKRISENGRRIFDIRDFGAIPDTSSAATVNRIAIQTAIIAGTMAVKKTSELIPFCHPLPVEACDFEILPQDGRIAIRCSVTTTGKTGVEMEAITGASVAALTVYDMCKALNKGIVIGEIKLLSKTGGKSGDYHFQPS